MEQDEETKNEHFIIQDVNNDMDDKEEDVDENSQACETAYDTSNIVTCRRTDSILPSVLICSLSE